MESKRYSERLTPENAALLLIDHQVGLFTGVRDIPVGELKHNVVALAKAAKVLGVPIIVTATSPELCMERWTCLLPFWSDNWREDSPSVKPLAQKFFTEL